MFEIRIICDPADTLPITRALGKVFATGPVRQHATRQGRQERLYISAMPLPQDETWDDPDRAYKGAPSIADEIVWTDAVAARTPDGEHLGREFWLREAAVLDRVALKEERDGFGGSAGEIAGVAARRLMDLDRVDHVSTDEDPRAYVRRAYARWLSTQ